MAEMDNVRRESLISFLYQLATQSEDGRILERRSDAEIPVRFRSLPPI